MRLGSRQRREWRIILWVCLGSALISAYFGYAVAPPSESKLLSACLGVVISFMIATPIALVQLKGQRSALLRRLRRLPLAAYLAVKLAFYFVVIVGAIVLVRVLTQTEERPFALDDVFRKSLVFAVAMSVIGNLVFDMGALLGFGTLRNLLTGRYVHPRREQRAFLLIDMKDSTGLAERLGPVAFHELLNLFFRHVSDAALECGAEIHKYVGDEAILSWPETAVRNGDCLACPFLVRTLIAADGERYRRRFGVVPEFRAALHCGEIVAGEIGDVRREIAYVGDTLNVTARLLDAAKSLGHAVLASDEVLARAALPAALRATSLPRLTVRGRAAPLEISALQPAMPA
jgi:adenylate cyclase